MVPPEQLDALENGQEVDGYENGLHYMKEQWNVG